MYKKEIGKILCPVTYGPPCILRKQKIHTRNFDEYDSFIFVLWWFKKFRFFRMRFMPNKTDKARLNQKFRTNNEAVLDAYKLQPIDNIECGANKVGNELTWSQECKHSIYVYYWRILFLREGPPDHDLSTHTKIFRFRSFYCHSIGYDLKSLCWKYESFWFSRSKVTG